MRKNILWFVFPMFLIIGCAVQEDFGLEEDQVNDSDQPVTAQNDTDKSGTAKVDKEISDSYQPDETVIDDIAVDETLADDDTVSGQTFDKNGKGMWFDEATSLFWEEPMGNKGVGGMGPSHANSEKYCTGLNIGGAHDWRLPTIDEQRTLIRGVSTTMTSGKCPTTAACSNQDTCNKDKDNTQGYGNSCLGCQALDPSYDPAFSYLSGDDCKISARETENGVCYRVTELTGPCDGEWSATPNTSTVGITAKAFWYTNYKRALINSDADSLQGTNWVRCVRTGSPADKPDSPFEKPLLPQGTCVYDTDCETGKYCVKNTCIVIPADVYTDSATGLSWQANIPKTMSWAAAQTYCDSLDLGGQTDWRVPTISELKSVVKGCTKTASCGITDSCAGYTACKGDSGDCKNGCGTGNYLPEELGLELNTYWSSTEESVKPTAAWVVNFNSGSVSYMLKTWDNVNIRCVRK